MVRNRLLFSSLMWAFCLGGVNSHNEDVQSSTIRAKFSGTNAETKKAQIRRSLMDYMMPGNRVAEMDRADAICGAHYSLTTGTALEKTDVSYYYAIESSTLINGTEMTGISVIHMLEQQLYESISGMFLWCYYEEYPSGVVPSTGEGDMGRNLNAPRTSSGHSNKQGDHRRLTLEEARRLGIVTFSSTPFDQQRLDIPCNFPVSGEYCIVLQGMITIMHHSTSDVRLAAASVLDSTQMAMDNSDIFLLSGDNPELSSIIDVKWLGVTEEEAINGGPNGTDTQSRDNDNNLVPLAYAVALPMLLLTSVALLVARNRARRQVTTPDQMMDLEATDIDFVRVGTGDPPRSFHEGLYHYTRHGARYLSTNCPECIETLNDGFFTINDLDTIVEGDKQESFEDISVVEVSSSNEKETIEHNSSYHRKRNLVIPSDSQLGVKHSSIDVHNCSSATCKICAYKPHSVSFMDNNSPMFGSSDDFCKVVEV